MKNLVFTSAGDKCCFHKYWCNGTVEQQFDIFTCYYDDPSEHSENLRKYSKYFTYSKGSKFQNLYKIYKQHRDILDRYDAIFVMDDDIIISQDEINILFKLLYNYDLWVLQPSFNKWKPGKGFHDINVTVKDSYLRLTNFIELNVPLFKKDKLFDFLENIYDPILVGFGIDYLYMWYFGIDKTDKYAISDNITCVNPADEVDEVRKIDKLQSFNTRSAIWNDIKTKLNIPSYEHTVHRTISHEEALNDPRAVFYRKRLLLYYQGYPRLSQTYMTDEALELNKYFELMIVSIGWILYDVAEKKQLPYKFYKNVNEAVSDIDKFKPQIIHGHFLNNASILHALSARYDCKFTIRTHSFDVLGKDHNASYIEAIKSNNCLAVLCFPTFKKILVELGYDEKKIYTTYPSIDINAFTNTHPNGRDIMSGGALLPKKDLFSMIELAQKIKALYPDINVRHYSVAEDPKYYEELKNYNLQHGNPLEFRTVQPEDMPNEYKKHKWLIYIACPKLRTVGYPLCVAEAQASGVGVLLYKLRDDMTDFIGDAGYFFTTHEEVLDIISKDFPEDKRDEGFKLATRYDIKKNMKDLIHYWHYVC